MELERTNNGLRNRGLTLLASLLTFPPHKLPASCHSRLAKLLHSELRFLHHLSPVHQHANLKLCSTNLGYLEAIIHVLRHPFLDGASAVLQTIRTSSRSLSGIGRTRSSSEDDDMEIEAHVDVVCTFEGRPVWFVVADRNPKYIHWLDQGNRRGLKCKLLLLLRAALADVVLQPAAIIFCFAKGVSESVAEKLQREHGASRIENFGRKLSEQSANESCEMVHEVEEGEWINIHQVEEGEWINIFTDEDDMDRLSIGIENRRTGGETVKSLTCFDGWAIFQIEKGCFHYGLTGLKELGMPNALNNDLDLPLTANLEVSSLRKDKEDNINLPTFSQTSPAAYFNPLSFPGCCGTKLDNFRSLLEILRWHKGQLADGKLGNFSRLNLVNLDTTAMVALVSEVSNGQAQTIVNMSEEQLRHMFRNTSEFMKEQAESELERPLLWEVLMAISHRRPFISQFVCDEFKSLVSMCGGSREKQRAEELLHLLLVLPTRPSVRVMSLCETGRIKKKNKIIFGTGDTWHAPTLTANMAFVRAARQTGMALAVIEHRPRALVGDKCG